MTTEKTQKLLEDCARLDGKHVCKWKIREYYKDHNDDEIVEETELRQFQQRIQKLERMVKKATEKTYYPTLVAGGLAPTNWTQVTNEWLKEE